MIFIVFLVFVSFFFLIVKEFDHNEIILDAVVVPEDLVKSGYTGTVVAGKLLDSVRKIGFEVEKSSRDNFWHKEIVTIREMGVEDYMNDIQVPGAGFTLRSFLRYARQIFGIKSTYLHGEITQSETGLVFTVRNITDSIPAAQTPVKDDLGQLIKEYGGTALLKISRPEMLAIQAYQQFNKQVSATNSYDKSLQKLNEIIDYCLEHSPAQNDALALYLRGSAFYKLKDYDAAIKQFRKIISLYPEYVFAYNDWGVVLDDLTHYEEAIKQFKKAIEIDPEYATAYNNWSLVLYRLKRYDEAIIQYQKAVELDPEFAFAYYNWGNALYGLKRYDEAIAQYQKAVEIDSEFTYDYNIWGDALYFLGHYDEAIAQYQKAVGLDPENANIYHNWGFTLTKLGRDEEADAIFLKARKIEQAQSGNDDPSD